MLIERCVRRRSTLPILPCDCDQCVWYIYDSSYNDCFWVLSEVLNFSPGMRFTIEEIANLENISTNEVIKIIEIAFKKLREYAPEFLDEDSNEQVSY